VQFRAGAPPEVRCRADGGCQHRPGLRQMTPQALDPRFLGLAVLLGAGTAYAVYRVFLSLRRDRFAADTPLAHIRSAAQGYVHLEGEAGPPPEGPISAPLSGPPTTATSGTSPTAPPAWRRSHSGTRTGSVWSGPWGPM